MGRYFVLFAMLICATTVFAQQKTVHGTVTDRTGDPLIGVNVQVKGTATGTITDLDGKYSLDVPAKAVLVFSYIGYQSAEAVVGAEAVINRLLQDDTQAIDEVIVVGYGVQKKVTVTGSVASVQGERLKASPTTNITNAMVGRMPGVIGFQRSDEPGGGGTTIRIRGTNSLGSKDPLVVIDGVPGRAGGMDRLNPNDIESISVLKDASAAIYGSRAANGVILVTTKRGKDGKPTITYTGQQGYSSPTRMPEMTNAFEYATMRNDISRYRGNAPFASEEDLRLYKDGSDPWGHPNTNYMEQAVKDLSPMYRHDVAISGGNDRVKYYVNLAANGEDGIFKSSANRFDNFSVRANLDLKVNDHITLSYGNVSRMEVRNYPTFSASDIFTAIVRSKPTDIGFYPDGHPGPDLEYGHNPVVAGTDATGQDLQHDYYIQNTLKAVVTVPGVKGLTLTATGSYDKYFKTRKLFKTPFSLYRWNGDEAHTFTTLSSKGWSSPELTQERTDRTSWMANAFANYDFSVGSNNFGVSAGIEGEDNQQDWLTAFRRYFMSDALAEIDNGGRAEMNNGGNSWEESRLNYFGRVSYNYLERYLLEFVWRYDGSYRFPKDQRYGFFPGVSAAWRVSEEGFWKENVPFIDYFKLRASVSQTGNDALLDADGNYDRSIQYLNTYGFGTDYLLGSTFNKTLKPTRTPNPNITWEVGTTYDLGFEFKFLQNRLSWESDLFYHKRTNMLISRNASLPQTSGITLPRENLGEMSNRGIESLVTWNDKAGKVQYDISANITYAKNRIDFWDETPNIPDYQRSTGKPVGTELFYVADGVFNTEEELKYPHWKNARLGDIKFVDINGDGEITADDRVRLSKVKEPTFVFGINLGARWNNFDLMALLQGATGGHTYIWRERAGEAGNFYKYTYDHRWTEENPMIEHPRTYNREDEYWASEGDRKNTYYLWNTDFIRLKNLEIGYTFNFPAVRNAGIQNLRVFANGTNLLTIDKVRVQDPEQNNTGRDYPQRRVVNFGASITF
ncbi:Outer membrane cobalamin receptor protein, SusC/RagA family [Bacteroidales bacterium Barb6XT]|nr:Outer membrane cobalamin receptor protein, SusC/RagA family [Bacteroidales bacterium Barb6XT]